MANKLRYDYINIYLKTVIVILLLDITKRRLKWAGYSWRTTGSLVKIVQGNVPQGKQPLGRLRLRWEDRVKEDIEKVRPGIDWKALVLNREMWRQIY